MSAKLPDPSFKGKEKRIAARLYTEALCKIIFEDSNELAGNITNISFTGAFVSITHDDPESFVNLRGWLEFSLILRNKPFPVRVSGMVVRSTDTGLGVAFRSSEHIRIESLVEKLREELDEADNPFTSSGQTTS